MNDETVDITSINLIELLSIAVSSTNPGKQYEIRRGKDGVIYCTCQAWKIKKTCKHLTAYQESTLKSATKKGKPVKKQLSVAEVVQQQIDKLLKG